MLFENALPPSFLPSFPYGSHGSLFLPAVNRIKEQYKVSVRIPQDSDRSGLVRIEGDPKGVQLARRELIEMVQRMVRIGSNFRLVHSFI